MTAIEQLFARAQRRARVRTIGRSVAAGALALGAAPALTGCLPEDAPISQIEQEDWAQYEGVRNTEMVRYYGEYWSECRDPYTRFGCGSMDIFVKLRVKPVPGADLSQKQVGVVYRNPNDYTERTAFGEYYGTWPDGFEEWHVRVNVPTWSDFFVFDAFYRDGNYHTYYDDNQGELHVINDGPDRQIITVNTYASTVRVTDDGVEGKVQLRVTDLDYDKQIVMYATTDDWATVLEYEIGSPSDANAWYWVEDVYNGDLWEIDLDIPADTDRFEYAVVYKHGVVNDAREYWFWDNNGGANYVVEKPPVIVE